MKTINGREVPETVKAVLYLCHYDYSNFTIKVVREMFFNTTMEGLIAYSEIPNPPSQLACGKNYEELCFELEKLHKNLNDEIWVKELAEYL